jgi:signal transduction histidine kinase
MNTYAMRKFSQRAATVRMRGIRFLYRQFIAPKSENEDQQRHEYILNIILTGSIVALLILETFLLISWSKDPASYSGIPITLFTGIVLFFISLLILSRQGYFAISSYLLIGLYFFSTTYGLYQWSFLLPTILLGYVITITIAGMLVSTRAAMITTLLVTITTIGVTYFQISGSLPVTLEWRTQELFLKDAIEPSVLLVFIMVISWLSNRQIEHSLMRARKSEQALLRERDTLEVKVEERTRELKQMQQEKLGQLYHFAEFGRLSSGIFHDLMNPLSALIAHVSDIETYPENLPAIKVSLSKAVATSKRIGEFISTVKKQVRVDELQQVFLINKEIEEAIDILQYRAREAHVTIKLKMQKEISTYGNPLKFHQVAVNLIVNAIDATEQQHRAHPCIYVKLAKHERSVIFSVADEGCGIPESIRDKIFDPFFTTKSSKGIGLGLSTTKTIVEKEFAGTINVQSVEEYGTIFKVMFPLKKNAEQHPV